MVNEDEARNMFIAVGLELACGLRRAEAAQVTWEMFTRRYGAALLEGQVTVKNQTGQISIPPIDPFWKLLNRRIDRGHWRGKPQEFVLTGHKTDRTENVFRKIGEWLRALGWKTEKTNHALRAYSGCQVAMRFDIYRAQSWLRHRSVTTTQGDYGHFIRSHVFRPEKIRVRWAK
jgi:integrase